MEVGVRVIIWRALNAYIPRKPMYSLRPRSLPTSAHVMVPSHYLNHHWLVFNWNKLQWNYSQNTTIFIYENALESICKIVAILYRPLCVNYNLQTYHFRRLGRRVFIWVLVVSCGLRIQKHHWLTRISRCLSVVLAGNITDSWYY